MQPRDDARAELAERKARIFLAAPVGATILLGDSHARRWPKGLQIPGQKNAVVNLGIGGDRLEDIHWRIAQWPLSLRAPDRLVVFAGGTNHVAGEEASLILERFRGLVSLIRQQVACPAAVVGLLPRGKNFWYRPECVVETNDGIRDMSREFVYMPVFVNQSLERFGAEEGLRLYFSDYAHLNQEGYKVVAACLREQGWPHGGVAAAS